jgi:hypothetical protein
VDHNNKRDEKPWNSEAHRKMSMAAALRSTLVGVAEPRSSGADKRSKGGGARVSSLCEESVAREKRGRQQWPTLIIEARWGGGRTEEGTTRRPRVGGSGNREEAIVGHLAGSGPLWRDQAGGACVRGLMPKHGRWGQI